MKYFFYLFLFIALASCKKEEPGIIGTDYSRYNGNYIGVKTTDAVNFTSESTSDCILISEVIENQLFFNDVFFSLPSPTVATSFSVGDLYYSGANLNYNSDFSEVELVQRYDGGITKVDLTFNGIKTELASTEGAEHPLRSQLEGTFILNIQKKEVANAVDLSYTDTVSISMSGFNPVIDNEEYSVNKFYTFYTLNSLWNQGVEQRNLYWVEDSIYFDYKSVPSGTTDTVHHVFAGRKM